MVKKQPPDRATQFIEHLQSEVAYLRSQNAFLNGKCERLELAVLQPKGIEAFTPQKPIESVKVEASNKVTAFQRDKDWWNKLTEQQQQEILDGRTQ